VRPSGGSDTAPIESFLESFPVEHLLDIDERLRSYYGSVLSELKEYRRPMKLRVPRATFKRCLSQLSTRQ